MRTTVIRRFDAEREEAYDPDNHELLTPDLSIELMFGESSEHSLEVRYEFSVYFLSPDERTVGSIDIVAIATLTDLPRLPTDDEGDVIIAELPENVLRLIEGGLAEDVLLPASAVARGMRLPSLLPIPRIFRRGDEDGRAEESPEGTNEVVD